MLYKWQNINENKLLKIIEYINSFYHYNIFANNNIRSKYSTLSFFSKYHLVNIKEKSFTPHLNMALLVDYNNIENGLAPIILNGDFEKIHEAQKNDSFYLNDQNILDYTKFYFNYVFPPEGKIHVIESLNDIKKHMNISSKEEPEIEKLFNPARLLNCDENKYKISANLIFKHFIYNAIIDIYKSGNIDIPAGLAIDKKLKITK